VTTGLHAHCGESPTAKEVVRVSGNDNVGVYTPPIIRPADFPRISPALLTAIMGLPGAATTGSDVLDELGLSLAVPSDVLRPRTCSTVIAGQVLTLSYLPERRALSHPEIRLSPSRLAHNTLFAMGAPGDVVVVDARGSEGISLLGGMAAASAHGLGIAACIVDGGVRDLDEIDRVGLGVWSRSLTPRTGKWRLEAFGLNVPVSCGGVQVHPGDVAIADHTGICFFPVEIAEQALTRILEISAQEARARST
jgi:4-hydroxy-4-methyl-2-oxoglutarate aldolase